MVFGFDLVLGFLCSFPKSWRPKAGRTCGTPHRFWTGAQVQIASAVTQPVASVQPPFDLHRSSTKPCTNFFPQYPPAISVPAYRVVLSHSAGHPYTQDFFQVLFAPQSSMGIAWISRCHRKTLLPLGKKAHLQEMICSLDAVDSRQPHLLHQTILKSFKQPLDTPFRLRTVGRDPFNPQFVQGSPELRSQRISPQLFGKRLRAGLSKDAVFIGVMGQGTSVAPYPSAKRSQVLFCGVVLGEPSPDATGGIIDHGNQLASRTAVL